VPLVVSVIYNETVQFPMRIYAIPALISLGLGVAAMILLKPRTMSPRLSMAVGTMGWFALSLLGAIPYWLALDIRFVDALFEAVYGFTTTGVTFLTGLQGLPKSLLFWRALTQWIGGLGIFTLFLFVVREPGARHLLMGAETHKAAVQRFSPGVFGSLKILWLLYGAMTVACGLLLWAWGMSPFDAVAHALTTPSTGGFSTYDANIGHFAQAGYTHAVAIEYTILAFMLLGGTSFVVIWQMLRRQWHAVASNTELKVWGLLLAVGIGLVIWADRTHVAQIGWHTHIRQSAFHVVSMATSAGFTLRELPSAWFSPGTKQVLLLLMLIGGCVASTAGGLKVYRISILGSSLRHWLRSAVATPLEVVSPLMSRQILRRTDIEQAVAITVGWGAAIAAGWMAVTLIGQLSEWSSLSAVVSALSNIGPHFVPAAEHAALSPWAKGILALAMIAGRLEILPVIILFRRKTWR
ncbi:MAG TPA: TrkH family potassium uptake protein, partial [Candidatus Acetothermia bacterium]|nr:TrkH family potassium uptake protein [Candidatus Acetothermia bacterium]